jgi:hypothetical protein
MSNRDGVDATVEAAIAEPHLTLCHLVEIGFASGTIRLTDAAHNLTWNSQTWTGLGNLGQMDSIKEASTGEVTGLRFQLAAPISGYLSIVLGEHVQGSPVTVYVGFCNSSHVVVRAPVEWTGRVDTMTVSDSGENSVIQLTAESRVADWQRPKERRHNLEDHRIDYADDRFYEFVPTMVEKEIVWPAASYFRR